MAILTCVCCMFFTLPVSADKIAFSFYFTQADSAKTYSEVGAKADDVNKWVATLETKNNGIANTVSDKNIFLGRMLRKSGTIASDWGIMKKCDYKYKTKYIDGKYAKGYQMKLQGKKSKASTSGDTLRVSGRFNP